MIRGIRATTWLLAGVLAAGLSGCILVAAGAGAGGAVYMTGHTAEAIIDRPIDSTADAVERVLANEGVSITASRREDSGARRTWEGTQGEREITITVSRESDGRTKVQAVVKRNAVSWDDDYAKALLAKIIA
ncbi:MAG: DUF3568 family protein [Gemmatimonadota bacterium]|nr:DUF3568 family protein [Gemmatimonadota bacterium]